VIRFLDALVLGANIAMQTDDGEINGFERIVQRGQQQRVPQIVLYDDVPGGAGYVERLSHMLPIAAQSAYDRLHQCTCVDSCYRCLRTYKNQREHKLLDKRLVLETLQMIIETMVSTSDMHH
jgi:ATP-dependent helicase YprA (DUF1998 family)